MINIRSKQREVFLVLAVFGLPGHGKWRTNHDTKPNLLMTTLGRERSSARASDSRLANISRIAGWVTPWRSIKEYPKELPSCPLHTAAPTLSFQDMSPSTFILTWTSAGGFPSGCSSSRTNHMPSSRGNRHRLDVVELADEVINKEMGRHGDLKHAFIDGLPPRCPYCSQRYG